MARTFVLTITYRGTSPQQASAIARAFAEAYLDDQLEARYETSRRASEWLLARIAELRQKSLETDNAVQQFKARNEIAMNGQGQLVNQQQLGETNTRADHSTHLRLPRPVHDMIAFRASLTIGKWMQLFPRHWSIR